MGASALNSWMEEGDSHDESGATDLAMVEQRKLLLPRYNLEATSAASVYDIRGIVGENERGALRRQHAALASSGKDSGPKAWVDAAPVASWPSFVKDRLRAVDEGDKEAVVDLLLLRHLITLHLRQPKFFKGPVKDDAKTLGMPTELLT